jgi:hypothetical protein
MERYTTLNEEIERHKKLMRITEEQEYDQPDRDDCFISSNGWVYSVSCGGKFLGKVDEMEDALRMVKEWKAKNKWFPNTWFVSDHGNTSLIDDEGNIIDQKKIGVDIEEESISGAPNYKYKIDVSFRRSTTGEVMNVEENIFPFDENGVNEVLRSVQHLLNEYDESLENITITLIKE